MDNFSTVAKSAWTTDDGKTTFCVPMASVIHGFIYNKDAFKKVGARRAEDDGRVPRHPRQAEEGRNLHADRHGHRRPVGSRDHGLPEHRPQLLEGRDRPPGADRRQGEVHRSAIYRGVQGARHLGALHGRRLPGAEISRQPEPVLARQGGDLSRRLVGHLDLPRAGAVPDGRLPAAAAGRRRRIATSPTTPTSPWASTPRPRTRRTRRSSSNG